MQHSVTFQKTLIMNLKGTYVIKRTGNEDLNKM
jgi:hypothetical protein